MPRYLCIYQPLPIHFPMCAYLLYITHPNSAGTLIAVHTLQSLIMPNSPKFPTYAHAQMPLSPQPMASRGGARWCAVGNTQMEGGRVGTMIPYLIYHPPNHAPALPTTPSLTAPATFSSRVPSSSELTPLLRNQKSSAGHCAYMLGHMNRWTQQTHTHTRQQNKLIGIRSNCTGYIHVLLILISPLRDLSILPSMMT